MSDLSVIILAAGTGSRMKSKEPKVLQHLAGYALIQHVLKTVRQLDPDQTIVVHGHLGEKLQDQLRNYDITWVNQRERLGTGHAVLQALPYVKQSNKALILYGDVPLIGYDTLQHFVHVTRYDGIGLLTAKVDNPKGLGRIVRNKFNEIEYIVEQKDASEKEKQIKEVNTGIYCLPYHYMKKWLPQLGNQNVQGEYYLTDVVEMAKARQVDIRVAHPVDTFEIYGVNTRVELAQLERLYHRHQIEKIMLKGVTVADPSRVDIRGDAKVGQDSFIDINIVFKGTVIIGENCIIGPNCIIENAEIASGVEIKANTILEGSYVGSNATVGPYARVRPGCHVAENTAIGNFVEIKQSNIGEGSKVNHLAYIGNTEVGRQCNIGAGVITCNYDGANKLTTTIEDDVFVGTNSSLIAPVTLHKGSTIGAGSTITNDVTDKQLAIARAKQTNINGWQRPTKKNKN